MTEEEIAFSKLLTEMVELIERHGGKPYFPVIRMLFDKQTGRHRQPHYYAQSFFDELRATDPDTVQVVEITGFRMDSTPTQAWLDKHGWPGFYDGTPFPFKVEPA